MQHLYGLVFIEIQVVAFSFAIDSFPHAYSAVILLRSNIGHCRASCRDDENTSHGLEQLSAGRTQSAISHVVLICPNKRQCIWTVKICRWARLVPKLWQRGVGIGNHKCTILVVWNDMAVPIVKGRSLMDSTDSSLPRSLVRSNVVPCVTIALVLRAGYGD